MTTFLLTSLVIYVLVAMLLYVKMLHMSKTDSYYKHSNRLKSALVWPKLLIVFAMVAWILFTDKQKD